MRLGLTLPFLGLVIAGLALWALVPWGSVAFWAVEAQRAFQDSTAGALMALRGGDTSAIWVLCGATAAYGFVHALGPGHGKILLGGAALASGATLRRMTALTLVSSLAQAGTAILLVGVFAVVFGLTSEQLKPIADDWLAPASYAAIAALGLYLIWRGQRHWRRAAGAGTEGDHQHHGHHHHHHHDHDHVHAPDGSCCGHAHGPSLDEVETLGSLRDAALLVASIAIRPCTGAILVLVIALRFDVFWVGCLAVVAMGLGTAAFNLLVAWSGVAARRLSLVQSAAGGNVARASACVEIVGGLLIMLFSVMWLLRFWA